MTEVLIGLGGLAAFGLGLILWTAWRDRNTQPETLNPGGTDWPCHACGASANGTDIRWVPVCPHSREKPMRKAWVCGVCADYGTAQIYDWESVSPLTALHRLPLMGDN